MKKIVFIFGLIAGLIVTAMMIGSVTVCYNNADFEGNMVIGFAVMALAFSMVFVGIKNYRDKYLGGQITFLKALKVGLLITLVASTMYVVVWLIDFYIFIPDFLDKYEVSRLKAMGPDGKADVEKEMAMYRMWYKTPIGVILVTYMEILPMGILITLISALILKRKRNENSSYQRAGA
ncbi:DUF4199 domain-containing protein [Chitinophaga barathri]|uniref:DUF4199 domain-containing protein n=1 Tax=Chitinophaga barathri TaxID=1647451 RepID=A0A3N4MGC3_9BACT|nr:DUF4199 domain-containing protein [Chitinophaga barathri]RPD42891.1 DUF4199 domain-containing protein [Chitinophaga barathri]